MADTKNFPAGSDKERIVAAPPAGTDTPALEASQASDGPRGPVGPVGPSGPVWFQTIGCSPLLHEPLSLSMILSEVPPVDLAALTL